MPIPPEKRSSQCQDGLNIAHSDSVRRRRQSVERLPHEFSQVPGHQPGETRREGSRALLGEAGGSQSEKAQKGGEETGEDLDQGYELGVGEAWLTRLQRPCPIMINDPGGRLERHQALPRP